MAFDDDQGASVADASSEAGMSIHTPTRDSNDFIALQNQAVQNVEHGIVVVNDTDGTAKVNPAAARILRIPSGFCSVRTFVSGLEALRLRSAHASSLATRMTELLTLPGAQISKWLWHVEEPTTHLRVSVTPVQTDTLEGHVWVFQDVSELFDALRSVHSLEHRLHQLLTVGDVIAFRLRRGGEFQWVSPSTMRMLGFNESAYLGRNATDHCHPADTPLFAEKVKTMRATGEPQHVAFRINDAAGRERSLEGRIFLAHDDHESIEAILSDVTSHVELENLRAQVTSAVSHEFKTPLAFMATALTMMEDGILDPSSHQGREAIDRMLSASKRLARMSDTLLTLQHLEITRTVVAGYAVNPGRLVERAALTVPVERQISIDIRDQTDDLLIHLDADLLEQAVINLVDNAVRHSPTDGVVEIVTRVDGDKVTITVRDFGPGVPKEFRSSIFEPFVRLHRDQGGVGLGLAIVDRIARLHHGSIEVGTPGDGVGSIFTLTLTDMGRRQ